MIDLRLSKLLGFDANGTFVKNVQTSNFGKQVVIECICNPRSESIPYRIVLEECKNITWQIFIELFDPPGTEDPNGADLIGLNLGEDQYRSVFVAHTDVFEIVISYQSLKVSLESQS